MTLTEIFNLGHQRHASGQLAEAETLYRQVLAMQPNHAPALHGLGVLALQLGRGEEAVGLIRRAIAVSPDSPSFHLNLGAAYHLLERIDEAVASYRKSVALRPGYGQAYNNLASAVQTQGDMPEAVTLFRKAVAANPANAVIASNLIFALQFDPACDAKQLLASLREWDQRFGMPLRGQFPKHPNKPDPVRRLRIGYLSADFRDHVAGWYFLPLISQHDRKRFEIFCYYSSVRGDAVTERIKSHADGWREISKLNDEQAARSIQEDRIDIFVDLAMHMGNGRPLIAARKPAPVQAVWLAYPGSSGLSAIDYRLTDPYLDPPGEYDDCYVERSIRLADTFWCYDGPECDDPRTTLPAAENGYITFGCLNQSTRINGRTLGLWARVMKAVAGSRLILFVPRGEAREKILRTLGSCDIDAGRIEFLDRVPRRQYLESYHRIDLGLDTLPYNGHTTSLDAFWMGVPVVTRVGETVVGRAGWSQLSNLGLTELAGWDDDEFVRIATELAADQSRLTELRRTLRGRMKNSPLTDSVAFTRSVEGAYDSMWKGWVEQKRAEIKETGA